MEFKAHTKFTRIAPRKVRLVACLVRNLSVTDALQRLHSLEKKSALVIKKLLLSAVANAKYNGSSDISKLLLKTITVDQGPMLKRRDTRAMGRAEMIRKRMSHIHIILSDIQK